MRSSPFARVRAPEAEALKRLSPNASKLWIALRFGRSEAKPFEVGIRDFEDWNIQRTAAAKALEELIQAGLLKVVSEASFGRKRKRRVFDFACKRDDEIQTAYAVKPVGYRPPTRSQPVATDREGGHERQLQTAQAVILKKASSPSAQKPKGEEAMRKPPPAPPPEKGGAVDVSEDQIGEKIARAEERVRPSRERQRRIGNAASALGMGNYAFMRAAGGPEGADFIARRFEAGLTADQLRTALAEVEKGSGKGKGVDHPPDDREAENVSARILIGSGSVRFAGKSVTLGRDLRVVQVEAGPSDQRVQIPRKIGGLA